MRHDFVSSLGLGCLLMQLLSAQAAPNLTSRPPANGVSPSAPLVFTLSEAMNTSLTAVDFFDLTTFAIQPTTAVWSGGDTVLTCARRGMQTCGKSGC